ncbi:MAG TPA: DUF2760 domain-containing protein [Opitutaceae bacterium]
MEPKNSAPSFLARLGLAFRVLTDAVLAQKLVTPAEPAAAAPRPAGKPAAVAVPSEKAHAPALALLAMLQREGRLIDFLQEDVAAFADADIGAAARVVHAGCRKALAQHLTLEPVLRDAEGAAVTVPVGFDAQRIRLTGNVAGQPPYRGALKHHGWVAKDVRLPVVAEALDPLVLAPAEVEL